MAFAEFAGCSPDVRREQGAWGWGPASRPGVDVGEVVRGPQLHALEITPLRPTIFGLLGPKTVCLGAKKASYPHKTVCFQSLGRKKSRRGP